MFHGTKDKNNEKFSNQCLSVYLTLNLTDFKNSDNFFPMRHYSCSFFKNICPSMGNYR